MESHVSSKRRVIVPSRAQQYYKGKSLREDVEETQDVTGDIGTDDMGDGQDDGDDIEEEDAQGEEEADNKGKGKGNGNGNGNGKGKGKGKGKESDNYREDGGEAEGDGADEADEETADNGKTTAIPTEDDYLPAGPDNARPNRAKKVPERAEQSVKELKTGREEHEQRLLTKKRKLLAQERPNSSQPGPLSEEELLRKKRRQNAQTSILDYSVDQLLKEEDRIEWYLAAIAERDGKDLSNGGYNVDQLKQAWLQEPQEPEEAEDLDKVHPKAKQTLIQLGNKVYVMAQKQPKPAGSLSSKVLPRLDSTDHMTILAGLLVNPKHPRGVDGKPVPEALLFKTPTAGIGKSNKGKQVVRPVAPKEPLQAKKPAELPVSLRKQNHNPSSKSTKSHTGNATKVKASLKSLPAPSRQLSNHQLTKGASTASKTSVLHSKPMQDQDEDELTEEDSEAGDTATESESMDIGGTLTKRSEAQLRRFGSARPLVSKTRAAIRLRGIIENPFANICINWSEPDKNGIQHSLGTVAEAWIIEEWDRLNAEMRRGKPALPLLPAYVGWIKPIFSTIRHDAFTALGTSVETAYELKRSGDTSENPAKVKSLLPDAFLSPDLTPSNPQVFTHEILQRTICHCYFANPGKSYGFHHSQSFSPMPFSVFSLFAVMIHVSISHYAQGEYQPVPLVAEDQLPWYNVYMNLLKKMKRQVPTTALNLQRTVFDFCHGNSPVKKVRALPVPDIDFGEDSKERYVPQVIVEKQVTVYSRSTTQIDRHQKPRPQSVPKRVPKILVVDSSPPPQAGPSRLPYHSPTGEDVDQPVEELMFTDEDSD